MKRSIALGIALGALLVGITARPAHADDIAKVTVPFSFVVNNRTLPAGQYEVRTDDGDSAMLMIDGIDHPTAHADVITIPEVTSGRPRTMPSLTFVKKDGVMVLSELLETCDSGREIVLPKAR